MLEGSPLLRETLPLTKELTELAEAGLEALEQLESGKPAAEAWWEGRKEVLSKPKKPPYALELAIRPAVRKLMEAARGERTANTER